jgi:hypothetical protein
MYWLASSKRVLDDTAWQNIYEANAKQSSVLGRLFSQADESGDHKPRVVSNSIAAEIKAIIE